MSVRNAVRKLVRTVGYDLAKKGHVPHWDNFFEQIESRGLAPSQIFDVGVGYGTPALYSRFPGAELHMFDPSRECVPHATRIVHERRNATFYPVALGSKDDTASLTTLKNDIEAASFYPSARDPDQDSYPVPVRRFDGLITEIKSPSLCKIDAQGFEIEIIHGMGERAKEVDFYIVESALQKANGGAPEFCDLQELMTKLGFRLFEIGAFIRRPRDGVLAQIDAVYVNHCSPLRENKGWT